ncbi:MAG: response regulator, partial [Xanthomonadaceae bacterium]|nr:response regulator [Xanthomonadaceae bacterium]
AESIQQAKLLLGENRFDICLTDMRLGDGSGIDLISYVSEHYANMPIAMITAYGDVQSAVNALKAGAYDFVSKPVDLGEMRQIVQRGLLLGADNGKSAIGNSAEADEHSQPLPEALARLEREQIRHALESCRYNKTKAAAQLGITFRALRYKMDKLGME